MSENEKEESPSVHALRAHVPSEHARRQAERQEAPKKRVTSEETKKKLRAAAAKRKLEAQTAPEAPQAPTKQESASVDYDALANKNPNKTFRQLYGMFKSSGMSKQQAWAEVLKRIR